MNSVRNAWAGGATPLWLRLSAPVLSRVYGAAIAWRSRRFDRRPAERASVPVLSVGNLTVGGTGKTPFSAWVVRELLEWGRRPALLLRGYGDDEVHLHAGWNPKAPVVVNGDRVAGAATAAGAGAGIVVLDDGFQHRRLARDLDIVLVSADRPEAVRLLPAGPYREPLSALARADVVVLVRRTADDARADAWRERVRAAAPDAVHGEVRFVSAGFRDLRGTRVSTPDSDVLAVSAIADPDPFVQMVASATRHEVESLVFGDHHRYDAADVERIARAAGPRPVVVTEKDAVKLRTLPGTPDWTVVLHLGLQWESGKDAFLDRMSTAVGARHS